MSSHDWRNWETCECGENDCRSSWANKLLRSIVADHGTEQEKLTAAPIPYDEMRRILRLPDHRPPCGLDDRDANPCTLPTGHDGDHFCEDAYWCPDCEDFHP